MSRGVVGACRVFIMKRGTGSGSAVRVCWDSDEKSLRSEKLRSTAPMTWAMWLSPSARVSSRSRALVGERRGSDGMLRMGSLSLDDGELGAWNVALFLRE